MKRLFYALPLLLFLILAGFLLRGLWLQPHHIPSNQIGKIIPVFRLPILGQPSMSLTNKSLINDLTHKKNQFFLINFFASWCAACKEEQAFLMQLAQQGIVIYGINYKDNPVEARVWLQNYGNPYQQIGLDEAGQTAIDFGVYGTPETFVVDSQGKILYRYTGPLNATQWGQKNNRSLGF